jgi:3-hydroxymyristoyl/3-hydroxydecanoyl-(acyl carrier protein) dehydratase
MSKINSFVLVLIIAISLSSCTDKSKTLLNTWRVDNVKFNKPIPPQMQTYIQSQIDFMKSYQRTTYNADGTFDDVQGPKQLKAIGT